MTRIAFALLAFCCLIVPYQVLGKRSDTPTFVRQVWSPRRTVTESNAVKPKTSMKPKLPLTSFYQRQRRSEKIEEIEEDDFLYADVRPKVLIHERDFHREAMRIAAWDEYVLVSILITSISYNALQGFTLNRDHEGIFLYDTFLKIMVQSVAGLAVMSGIYSTMVFSISMLYSKSALGLERDVQYDNFLDGTADLRIKAFRAFSLSLGLFAILVVLVLSEQLPLAAHLPVGSVMVGALFVGFKDWKRLVDKAKEIYVDVDDE